VDSVNSVSVGTSLRVTPTIGEQAVDMIISLSVSNVTGFADSRSGDVVIKDMPIVNSRSFSDRITVPIGREVVVSGLVRDRTVNNVKKMPFLGSLPVLGWFFGGESGRNDKTMVIAVVKPVRIDDMKNYSEESQKIVKKFDGKENFTMPETKIGFDQWLLDCQK
jgi:general secretion pathway protein D